MVSKKMKKEALEFLEAKLQEGGHTVKPVQKELVSGITSSYLLVDDEGIVFSVDCAYPNNALRKVLQGVRQNKRTNQGVVLYKDGKLFFRAGAPKNYFKKEKRLSLKHYSTEQIQNMVIFRPEEHYIYESRKGNIQYFQPESPRLEQVVATFSFKPVEYDYSHELRGEFQPENRTSSKRFIWTSRKERDEPLVLYQNYLIPKRKL